MVAAALVASLALAAPPATVLDHRVSIRVDAARHLTEEVVWTVRVEDPAACSAGVVAPPGLDGAEEGGARVLGDLLVVPAGTPPGAVHTFRQVRRVPAGEHAGVFLTAPDLPTERASITVDLPAHLPLTVWADPTSVPAFATGPTRRVSFSWTEVDPGSGAQAAWSTQESWQQAGASVTRRVAAKLVAKEGMRREWAEGVEGLGVAGVAERAYGLVALDPGAPAGSWATARPAAEVLASGSGTAAERGLALLSLLKVAGIEAVPGLARPAASRGTFPITVPAPPLLPRPIVVVRRPEGDVYVDPAAPRAAIPDRSASLLGATVWVPGELPRHLPELGVTDGAVSVNATLTFDADGSAAFSASVQATGAAQEYLRDLLAPLDEAGRTEALRRLVRQARPDLVGVTVSASGIEQPSKPLKISISGSQQGLLQTLPYGLRGTIPPILGPALAAWLPPRVRVQEQLSITPPSSARLLGTAGPDAVVHPDAIVGRTWRREGQKLTCRTEVERPYRATTPIRESAAAAFLDAESKKGLELLLFSAADATSAKAVRTAPELSPEDRAVLEALLWFASDQGEKAGKALARALPTTGFSRLVAGLEHWSDPSDLRPWNALSGLAASDADRMTVIEGLELAGARREALVRAHALQGSTDPDVKIRALLTIERLQGPPPATGAPAASPPWLQPLQLLATARDAAQKSPSAPSAPRVAFRLAELQIEAGDTAGAEATLEGAAPTALGEGLRAYAAAVGGVPRDEVERAVAGAVAKDPTDPWLAAIASDAVARVGDADAALGLALGAAQLARVDPGLWSIASERALAAGDLRSAVEAARRASDLDPDSRPLADRWATLASLVSDREAVDAARQRLGFGPTETWPLGLDDKLALDADALFAILEASEHEVAASPRLLAMRAQTRMEHGALDAAARDGMILATAHGRPEGWALAFAATAGRQFSTPVTAALDLATRTEPTAQSTRMEYRLVTGAGDPLEDARRLDGDPRAAAVITASTTPAEAGALVPGWPTTGLAPPPSKPPPGFRANRALSGPHWAGFSSPDAAAAVVRVGGVTGLLPPPLGAMYTPRAQAVRRLDDGTQVLALDGGIIPLFAAVRVMNGAETLGLGFTPEAAIAALRQAAP